MDEIRQAGLKRSDIQHEKKYLQCSELYYVTKNAHKAI